ncbi:hypothetical protein [Aquimarina brevivitae]|uniref:Uncharacterized protein n=1 Tax=Aquimarina brevivitae TaxID=323412 RepID=A0A4Q7P3D7_9FLAO|nr:hypothetical protein [Aquimarina brevivitae]RZS93192.1 hypothetical protein EV197_1763 [Aquimarina brevivitae]
MEERKLKLIWDFKGPNAHKTAEHHAIHLKDYALQETIPYFKIGQTSLHDLHSIAFIAVPERVMKKVRDDLKPHRGQLYTE